MIRAIIFFVAFVFSVQCYAGMWETVNKIKNNIASGSSTSTATGSEPSKSELIKGLKETLSVGVKRAVSEVSKKGGFYNNPLIRIPLPPNLKKAASVMEKVGYGDKVRDFELSMNRAAEEAAREALPIFVKAIKNITFDDAVKIWKGGNHAATDYLREKTWNDLYKAFKPIVKKNMEKVDVTRKYQALTSSPYMKGVSSYAGVKPLDDYVTEKALEGLFKTLAQEEERIRKDPAARTTDLLKKLFR
ncbi:MAG: DUF4197 domain-containing protein [Deferribacteres bacterium]|nr:DUF4197 domain-containing protein [Deferribacteres bacterium]